MVRIAPDELSYTTAQAWKDIFGFRQGHRQLPKNLATLPPVGDGNPDDIIHGDDATHSRFRRLLSHAFNARALEDQHAMIMSYVDSLIRRLHENASRPQDMVAWLNWTTFDLIGDLTFGEPFDCLKNQRYHPWVETILGGINGGVAISAAARYGLGSLLISLIPKSMTEKFDLMHAYTREKVARRLQSGTERPDFMSQLMRNDKDRKEMTQAEMEQNALTLVVAGSETTASLLSGTMYHLLRSPPILERVKNEVRSAFPSEHDIDCNSVNNLPYMIAVLKEGMRIYPPAPSSIPRKVMSEADTIDGRTVPPHTTVGLFQWACNHSASNFHAPDAFHPERWLDDAPAAFVNDSREAMQPFSYGPRNCLGKNLAYVEMRLILAKLLWHFDWELEGEEKEKGGEWTDQRVYLIWAKGPLMVKLTPVVR